jgi:hypothetical protein
MLQVSKKAQNYTVFLEGGSLIAYRCVNFKFYVMENGPFKPLLGRFRPIIGHKGP